MAGVCLLRAEISRALYGIVFRTHSLSAGRTSKKSGSVSIETEAQTEAEGQ